MSKSAMGIAVTTVTTDQQAPLGFIHVEPAQSVGDDAGFGERHWVYVFNDDGVNAFVAGQIIYRDPSAATNDWWGGTRTPVTVHQSKVICMGVVQHAIAGGSYGFILQKGVGTILAGSAALTLDTPFTTGGAGLVPGAAVDYGDDTNGANIGVVGHTATAIVGGSTGTAWIDCS